jgi:hypothetical protein
MRKHHLPEIPHSWLITIIAVSLVTLRLVGIDSWTTASLGMLMGYLTGKHLNEAKR